MKWITSLKNINDATALGTWFLVASISLIAMHDRIAMPVVAQSVLLFLIYAVAMVIATRPEHFAIANGVRYTLLGLMPVSAFGILLLVNISFLSILTIIWIGVIAHFVRVKTAAILLLSVVTLWFVVYKIRWNESYVIYTALLYGTFHVFALLSSIQAIRSRAQADELLQTNQQLVATQEMLREVSTINERTRIARDLHDLLGHHLTALTINLQVASRISEGEAKQKIEQSHQLAKLLLSDVREAVSDWREQDTFDFEKLLGLMLEKVPGLSIHQSIKTELHLDQIEQLKVMLSAIQEAITNSLKHSGAKNFWIELDADDKNMLLSLWDDGLAAKTVNPGNGLKGMRERVESVKGSLKFDHQNKALKLNIRIPLQLERS